MDSQSNSETYLRYANDSKYGSIVGEQYSIPLEGGGGFKGDQHTGTTSTRPLSSNSTIASSPSELLLEQYLLMDEKLEPRKDSRDSRDSSRQSWTDDIFDWLGFDMNPLSSTSTPSTTSSGRNSAAADIRLSMLANFSTAYNIISISLALHIMDHIHQDSTERDKALCSSSLIAGMILGQISGGVLGDWLGRHLAMWFVMCLQVVAAFGSACTFPITLGGTLSVNLYTVLAVWRFILGVGCGGVYPLAATISAESNQKSPDQKAKSVALTFSMQGVGYLVVPLVAWTLVSIFGEMSNASWRLLLGLGSLPGALFALRRWRRKRLQQINQRGDGKMEETGTSKELGSGVARFDNDDDDDDDDDAYARGASEMTIHHSVRTAPVSVLDAIMIEPNLLSKYMGTGVCWLIFDILFYGNTLFQPMVLSAAFGAAETIRTAARDTFVIACMALPGYVFSIAAVGRQTPRYIQLQGFLIMSVLYTFIGLFFDTLGEVRWLLLTLYGSTFLFSNYGPNSTTFMLPSMTFSKSCRSTLNGVCAASGKAGALLGSTLFVPAADAWGSGVVLLACAIMSLIGFGLTWAFVPSNVGDDQLLDTKEQILRSMTIEERRLLEQKVSKVPMKVVVSRPSLIDYDL